LRRNGSVDFPHIQGAEETGCSGQFQAAGVIGNEEIRRCAIAFSLQPIQQFRRAGGQQLDLNPGSRRKGIEDWLNEAFRTAGVDCEAIGGWGRGYEGPHNEEQKET
jgi:hypothetical protein